jgi:hypothetical protein
MSTFIFLSIGGGSGTNIPVVANYNALIAAYPPPNTTHLGQFVFVENAQGTWWIPGPILGTYYPAGLYYCNGVDWKTADVPYQAAQAEVDAGTVTDTSIAFDKVSIYNEATPATGNLTDDLTGARIGIVQKIYHNATVAPVPPAGWVKLGTGSYTPSTLNIIFAEWVSGTRVEYWIVKGS